jgi:hypothetical protein
MDPDADLWVRLRGDWTPDPQLRWMIFGNAHTHRGHFHVCSAVGDEHRTVNLGDVVDASAQARVWLAGFLAGQEATLAEFLGMDDELLDAADEADEERWRSWNARFREHGFAPALEVIPPRDLDLSYVAPPPPWCFVGGRYREWDDGTWRVADAQPDPAEPGFGWAWPGTVCAERRHHREEDAEPYLVCADCHHVGL